MSNNNDTTTGSRAPLRLNHHPATGDAINCPTEYTANTHPKNEVPDVLDPTVALGSLTFSDEDDEKIVLFIDVIILFIEVMVVVNVTVEVEEVIEVVVKLILLEMGGGEVELDSSCR